MDQDVVGGAAVAEPGFRRIQRVPREMLLPRNQREFRHSGSRLQPPKRGFGPHVAEDRAELRIHGDEDVVAVDGLGPRLVAGRGEIPEYLDAAAVELHRLAAFELSENPRIGGEFDGGGLVVAEGDAEALR